jgi:hypothetical protein
MTDRQRVDNVLNQLYKDEGVEFPYYMTGAYNNLIAAADILNDKEIKDMAKEYLS